MTGREGFPSSSPLLRGSACERPATSWRRRRRSSRPPQLIGVLGSHTFRRPLHLACRSLLCVSPPCCALPLLLFLVLADAPVAVLFKCAGNEGEPAIVGIVCACFGPCGLLFRWTLPRIRLPLSTDWGPALLRRQKPVLSDIGFASVAGSMSDDHTADMFAWICLTALVHFVSGCMTLLVVNGA